MEIVKIFYLLKYITITKTLYTNLISNVMWS